MTAIGSGTKLLTKTWWSIRKGRKEVKKAAREFYKVLRSNGIPEEEAKEITLAYAKPAWEMLSITNMIKMATEMSNNDSSPSISI